MSPFLRMEPEIDSSPGWRKKQPDSSNGQVKQVREHSPGTDLQAGWHSEQKSGERNSGCVRNPMTEAEKVLQ